MKNHNPVTPTEDQRIAELYLEGYSQTAIREFTGRSTSAIANSLNRSGIKARPKTQLSPKAAGPTNQPRIVYGESEHAEWMAKHVTTNTALPMSASSLTP